jgi:HEAT repeat protein
MPTRHTSRVFRVFLSSPGDVGEERAAVRELLDRELDQDPSFRGKISFEVVSWDDPAAPVPMMARLTPQEAVNRFRGKPSDCDIVIVILWSRLGTHLMIDGKPYLSGTEYEYEEAASTEPPPETLIYRRTEKILLDVDDPEFNRKREERQKVLTFFSRFRNPDGSFRGGVNEYATPTDFKELLEKNLREIITEHLEAEPLGRAATASAAPAVWQRAPYPGLRAFASDEAAIFFGRGRETDALVAELRKPDRRFTAVVGASGSGKSSLVYAGLLPRLAEGAIEDSADWRTLCFKPGAFGDNPLLALAAAMKPLLPHDNRDEPIAIAGILSKGPGHIATYVDQTLTGAPLSAQLILFADQAEELFSQATASHRQPFIDVLAEATGHPRVQVVLTMREDFLSQATGYPRLAVLLQTGTFVLGAPGLAALADMIRRPAQLAGLTLDHGLADEILHDVGSEPGALPLVAFCLETLYRSSASSRRLTLKAYEGLGGLEGAIRRRTAELLEPFEKKEGVNLKAALAKLFRLLVHVDAAGAVSRRRVFRDELAAEPVLEGIVEVLVQGRLLLADAPDRATVSLAHEVLLTAWPALHSWVEEHRAQLQRLDRVLSSLDSVDHLDCNYAVKALGEMGPAVPETVPALLTALSDPSYQVRKKAVEALAKIALPPAEAVSALLSSLSDSGWIIRERAATILGKIGPSAVPNLITVLGDAREAVRSRAAGALGEIGPPALPALVAALGDARATVRCAAAEALAKIGPAAGLEAASALITAVADSDAPVRASAVRALGRIGPAAREVVPVLVTALRDARASVRASAAEALGQLGPTAVAAVPALISALTDAVRSVRDNAAEALPMIGSSAVPALITTLTHADQTVRVIAADGLGKIGSEAGPEAVSALTTTLRDPDRTVRTSAADALGEIGPNAGGEAISALITALADGDAASVRASAAHALGQIGPPAVEAVPALIAALGDANWPVSWSAVTALAQIGPGAAPALVTALGDAGRNIRASAANALARIKPDAGTAAVPALIIALGDTDATVRANAADALAKLGPEAEAALRVALECGSTRVRRAAGRALRMLQSQPVACAP